MRRGSLRKKLVYLVGLALLPPLAFLAYVMHRDERAIAEQARGNVALVAGALAEHHERLIASTRDQLAALASDPAISSLDPSTCGRAARRVLATQPHLLNIGVAAADGRVVCSGLPFKRVSIADRAYFQGALGRGRFELGGYQIGRISGRPSMNAGYPITRAGKVTGVVWGSIMPAALPEDAHGAVLEHASVVLLVDRDGVVADRFPPAPGWLGRLLREFGGLAQVLATPSDNDTRNELFDGTEYVFGSARIPGLPADAAPSVVVGVPYKPMLSAVRSVQRQAAVALGACLLLVLGLTWWYGERFILRGIEGIGLAAQRFGEGDMSARAEVQDPDDELGRLAANFNEMADAVDRLTDRNRRILESADEGILGFDEEQRTSFVNPAAARLLGWEPSELIGMDFGRAVHGPEADTPAHRATCPLRKALDRAEPYRAEEFFVRRDGSRFAVECSLAPIRQAGAFRGSVVVFRDVSESQALRQQLQQAQKMESVGRLAGGVAHDFNNLLTAIGGFAHFLAEGLPKEDARREDVEEIRRAVERGSGLTRQLLAFSRQQVIQPRVLDLNELVSGCSKMLKRLVGEDVEVSLKLAAGLDAIKADAGQIEQVLLNLAVNARDAMPKGGRLVIETRNVELRPGDAPTRVDLAPGPHVLLSVTDTGTGIAPEIMGKIFDPFFTTKEQGKGTGLGLATVHGIARQHGGAVTVDSRLGEGTSFSVYFPRAEIQQRATAQARPPAASTSGSERVLLVEDDESVRKFARRVLSGSGYRVLDFGDPLAALGEGVPIADMRLLVTDMVMPGMHGTELARVLRERNPRLKTLFISGYTEASGFDSELERGAHFLQKPLGADALLAKVREALDG